MLVGIWSRRRSNHEKSEVEVILSDETSQDIAVQDLPAEAQPPLPRTPSPFKVGGLQTTIRQQMNALRAGRLPKAYHAIPAYHPSLRLPPTGVGLVLNNPPNYAELRRKKLDLLERSRIYLNKLDAQEPPKPKKAVIPQLTVSQREILMKFLKQPKTTLLGEPFKVQIYVDELRRLCNGNWLNDSIIDVMLAYFTENKNVFAFTTHFYTKLEEEGPKAVRRWSIRKKINVLQQDKILIPVNQGNVHWCLAVIDNKNQSLAYYDSLGGSSEKVLDNLENYLLMEADRLEPDNKDHNHAMIKGYKRFPKADCPMQNNGNDCGVCLTENGYFIANDESLDYTHADLPAVRDFFAFKLLQLTNHA